jgi:hypothetical protein
MPTLSRTKSALVARIPLACSDEAAAVAFMEEQRWGNSPACPRCGDTEVVQMKAKDGTRNARFLWLLFVELAASYRKRLLGRELSS